MKKPRVVQENVSLQLLNTWKVGGLAEFFSAPENLDELKAAYGWALANNVPVTLLSGGSNVLISDEGIRGLVVRVSRLNHFRTEVTSQKLVIEADTGTPKAQVMRAFMQNKLAPALFLAGLPGDIGGGVVMNAGVGESRVPREFCEIVSWIEVLKPDMQVLRLTREQITWTYRHSSGWQPGIIIRVGMEWPNEPQPEIMTEIKLVTRQRLTKQPLELPSCGSVFRNPPGHKSGKLIEECGLKGYTLGGAQVSLKHANFIVNVNHAKARDIHDLITHVRDTVFKKTTIQLETEVVYLGQW